MEALEKKYIAELEAIKAKIQASENLAQYLEEEEDADYKELAAEIEPDIQELYLTVANDNPLQLEAFEKQLLENEYEGLYLPKVVGYSVLRGAVDEKVKYRNPQSHFKAVLIYIANSSNFEMIKQRIGQSVQVGFALSSDIWITNLIEQIDNKKVRSFLENQKSEVLRDPVKRKQALKNYLKQFESLNYQSAEFPTTQGELKVMYHALRSFLLYRVDAQFNNDSLHPYISNFITNKDIRNHEEYLELLMIIGMFYDLSATSQKEYTQALISLNEDPIKLKEAFFRICSEFRDEGISITAHADQKMASLVAASNIGGNVSDYYALMESIHTKGYIHEDTIEAVRNYHDHHEGLSEENQNLRATIFNNFASFLDNIDTDSYPEFFQITKTFILYISIFSNQKFNQDVKDLSLRYIKRLLKKYVDKRGRDYQDIKKFVVSTFTDLNFMSSKELVELFKTKRNKVDL